MMSDDECLGGGQIWGTVTPFPVSAGERRRTGFPINGRDEAVPDPPPDPPPPREFERSRKGVQKESILEWKMRGDE